MKIKAQSVLPITDTVANVHDLDKILSMTIDDALALALSKSANNTLDTAWYEGILSKLGDTEGDAFTLGLASKGVKVEEIPEVTAALDFESRIERIKDELDEIIKEKGCLSEADFNKACKGLDEQAVQGLQKWLVQECVKFTKSENEKMRTVSPEYQKSVVKKIKHPDLRKPKLSLHGLTTKDKQCIVQFSEKEPGEGTRVSSDGTQLRTETGLGSGVVAEWVDDKVYIHDLGSKFEEIVTRFLKKNVPNHFWGGNVRHAVRTQQVGKRISMRLHCGDVGEKEIREKSEEIRKKNPSVDPSKADQQAVEELEQSGQTVNQQVKTKITQSGAVRVSVSQMREDVLNKRLVPESPQYDQVYVTTRGHLDNPYAMRVFYYQLTGPDFNQLLKEFLVLDYNSTGSVLEPGNIDAEALRNDVLDWAHQVSKDVIISRRFREWEDINGLAHNYVKSTSSNRHLAFGDDPLHRINDRVRALGYFLEYDDVDNVYIVWPFYTTEEGLVRYDTGHKDMEFETEEDLLAWVEEQESKKQAFVISVGHGRMRIATDEGAYYFTLQDVKIRAKQISKSPEFKDVHPAVLQQRAYESLMAEGKTPNLVVQQMFTKASGDRRAYFENDQSLAVELLSYAQDSDFIMQRIFPYIVQTLTRKIKKGVYDKYKAPRAFAYALEEAAKQYSKEFSTGSRGEWHNMFPKSIRDIAAEMWAEDTYAKILKGELSTPAREAKVKTTKDAVALAKQALSRLKAIRKETKSCRDALVKLSQEAEGLGEDVKAAAQGAKDWDSAATDKYEDLFMTTVSAAESLSQSLETASDDIDHIFQGNDL